MASGFSLCRAGTMASTMEPPADPAKLKLITELAGVISEAATQRRENMTRQILVKIRSEWRQVPEEYGPWGFWVREYASISADADSVDFEAVPERVWFFDRRGMRQENVWSWMRSVAVGSLAGYTLSVPLSPIGITALASYEGSDDYYIEVLWGGRWGEAWRVGWGSTGQMLIKNNLWKA